MIHDIPEGMALPEWPELALLQDCGTAYYLTGSYFFGIPNKIFSDVDVMTEDTAATRIGLLLLGFEVMKSGYYDTLDDVTSDVLQKGRVQVQLIQDVQKKRQARDLIREYAPLRHRYSMGANRTALWNYYLHLDGEEPASPHRDTYRAALPY